MKNAMNRVSVVGLLSILALSAEPSRAAAQGARAAAPLARPMTLDPASHLSLAGDSTLHKWKLDATQLQVAFSPAAPAHGSSALAALVLGGGITGLDVLVPVAGLKSGDSGLDDNMRKALKAEAFHDIRFQLDTYQAKAGKDATALALTLNGRLTIAGVEKPLTLEAVGTRDATGIRVVGEKSLLISDYGIAPPTFMLGAMKVRDPVVVHFDLQLDASS